jgi:hypothetical protein
VSIARVKASSLTQGLPKKKTLLAGNSTILPGSYESIATVTVGAGGSSTLTFSSIPATYSHLQIRVLAQNGNTDKNLGIRFNGDTATNYSRHLLYGTGASALATADVTVAYVDAYISPTGGFGAAVVDILDYANTNKYKTTRALGGYDANGSGWMTLTSGSWRSTVAINSITIYAFANSFAQYSTFALYGIK